MLDQSIPNEEELMSRAWSHMTDLKGEPEFIDDFKDKFDRDCPQTKEELDAWVRNLLKGERFEFLHFISRQAHELAKTMLMMYEMSKS